MRDLSHTDRLRLIKFVCSFAWADLKVHDEERLLVHKMVRRLDLDDHERKQVDGWLAVPPPVEEIDPTHVPPEHRELFLRAARTVIAADGAVSEAEQDTLDLLEQLLPKERR